MFTLYLHILIHGFCCCLLGSKHQWLTEINNSAALAFLSPPSINSFAPHYDNKPHFSPGATESFRQVSTEQI